MSQSRLKITATVILLASVFLLKCTYQPTESFFNPIEPPAQLEIIIDIESPEFSDPYYLDFSTTFSLSVEQTGKPLIEHHVTLNNTTPIESRYENNRISFRLDPVVLGVGTHKIQLTLTFKSMTGSLADQLGSEVYQVVNQFSVIVENQPPALLTALQPKIENGYLTLRWKVNKVRPFRFRMSNGHSSTELVNSVPNAELVYIDSGYVGTPTYYSLTVMNAFGTYPVGGVASTPSPTRFTLLSSPGQPTKLEWITTIFPANVTVIGPRGSKTVSVISGHQTLDSLQLGDELAYRLIVNRNRYPNQKFDSSFTVKSKKNIPVSSNIKVVSPSTLFLSQYGELYKLSLPDFARKDSTLGVGGFIHNYHEFNVNTVGNYLTTLAYGKSLPFLINPSNLKDITVYRALITQPDGNGSFAYATHHTAPSNNGLLGGNISYNGLPKPVIYDLKVNTDNYGINAIIWSDSTNIDTPLLSPDGNFFCLTSFDRLICDVFHLESGTWKRVANLVPDKRFFRGQASLEVISIGIIVRVYNLMGGTGTLQPVRQFTIPTAPPGSRLGQVTYDETSQMLVVETIDNLSYSTLRLYDIETFSFKGKVVAYVPENASIPARHVYSGGYHFITTGYGEKVKL